jgi:hypothetical protein
VTEDSSSDDEDNFFSVKSFALIINLCIHHMMAQSLVIELFLTKERLVTENYLNITSQMVQHTALSFSDEGL